ncbi:unnamed protein product [Gongylonema pulchrum]|uniref:ADF-H domain-containing protein n=1 Tax=Gongylonema pulchrum TaxID=637853 RepID=A0A183E5X8_9BILA|nr:unnamed protein product [Gongylonema pulchrum]
MAIGTKNGDANDEQLACMDEDDLETLKEVREQFLAADPVEIKEITEHAKQVDRFKILYHISGEGYQLS